MTGHWCRFLLDVGTEKIRVMTKPSFTERLTQFYVFTRTILEAKIERQYV